MIQRIQTVYLLVVAVLMVMALSLPVGNFIAADYTITEFTNLALVAADGTADYQPWALFALLLLVGALSLGTILLYKKRMLQIRITLFCSILLIGYYATLVAFVWMHEGDDSFAPSWSLCLPLVSIILNYLAIRAIGKDEMLVKAYERLR
ncbi:MAG: DUF4293 domain-containing protein [Phocaeicola plebeius]